MTDMTVLEVQQWVARVAWVLIYALLTLHLYRHWKDVRHR